jgi:hypothetical protein
MDVDALCHGAVGTVIRPDMDIMRVHNIVPCESHLIIKEDVSYKLCVYDEFCEKPLTKDSPCTMIRRSDGLQWVK